MKKLIAILVIAIVMVGAVFATDSEQHKLNVSVTLGQIPPQFALQYNSANSNTSTAFTNGKTDYAVAGQAATAGDDIVTDNVITVKAVVLNTVRQRRTYTLTFSGGALNLKINNEEYVLTPTIETASLVTSAIKGLNVVTATDDELSVPFAGPKMAAGVDLGTATYTYTFTNNYTWDDPSYTGLRLR